MWHQQMCLDSLFTSVHSNDSCSEIAGPLNVPTIWHIFLHHCFAQKEAIQMRSETYTASLLSEVCHILPVWSPTHLQPPFTPFSALLTYDPFTDRALMQHCRLSSDTLHTFGLNNCRQMELQTNYLQSSVKEHTPNRAQY